MSVVETLKKLIAFRTISGNHTEVHEAFEWIKDQIQPVPLYVKEHEYEGFESLIITTKETTSPKLWLAAHIDVVHGSEQLFSPWEKDGKLYGRGAFDMKFAIACYIEILKELALTAPEYDIGVMLTSDEEIGAENGTKALLEREGYRGDAAFLPDGGGPWQFEECAKSKLLLRLVAEGESAHGSRPWNGTNAISTLTSALRELEEYFSDFEEDTATHWHPSLTISMIEGGESENQVPAYASATLDIRAPDNALHQALLERIEAIVTLYPGLSYEIVDDAPAYGIARKNGEAKLFADIAKERYGIEMGWARSHGSSDGRFFAQHNIPTLLVWPEAGGAHSEHEWISIADLERFYEVTKEFVKRVGK